MIGKAIQILANEPLSVPSGSTNPLVYTSAPFTIDGLALWVLLVRVVGTVTGTSPTLTFAVQTSPDQVTWTTTGAALAAITAAGVQVTPYATGTTQGALASVTWVRVQATLGGTAPVFPSVYADLVAQQI